jgi:spore coat protein U-like protein
MNTLKNLSLVLALGAAFGAASAAAANATANLDVSASVANLCTVTTSPVAFGAYVPSGGNVDQTGAINVSCTGGTPYGITLGAGLGSLATVTTRKMTSTTPAGTLNYALYSDSAGGTNWGATPVSGTGAGLATPVVHTVFGRIPGGQTTVVASPSYLDTVVVSVAY